MFKEIFIALCFVGMIAAYPAESENVEIEKVAEPVEVEGDIDASEDSDLTGDESRYYGYRRHGWGGGYGGYGHRHYGYGGGYHRRGWGGGYGHWG